ncbi:MAG: hypothetical protein JO001_01390 [Alphaproteobacteria bacterium]|nr:hypothetical protein [Alphaproteobacteria bacterium]
MPYRNDLITKDLFAKNMTEQENSMQNAGILLSQIALALQIGLGSGAALIVVAGRRLICRSHAVLGL